MSKLFNVSKRQMRFIQMTKLTLNLENSTLLNKIIKMLQKYIQKDLNILPKIQIYLQPSASSILDQEKMHKLFNFQATASLWTPKTLKPFLLLDQLFKTSQIMMLPFSNIVQQQYITQIQLSYGTTQECVSLENRNTSPPLPV